MTVIAILLCISLSLRILDHWYYRNAEPVLRLIGLAPAKGERVGYNRPLDPVFATFPFVWTWVDIALVTTVATMLRNPFGYLVAAVIIGTRFRVLQEASHTGVHGGLCRSRKWQWALSNFAAQWPCFRPDMHDRFVAHVNEHHAHANVLGADPNITRFISLGFVPGISRARFRAFLLHPLSPAGFKETLSVSWANIFGRDPKPGFVAMRLLVVTAVAALFWILAGPMGFLACYVVPLLTVYPLCSWISAIAEHRWFARCDEADRRARECTNGRPTDYPGLSRLAKHTIFPFSDHYHLAHSLYPKLRWNYLGAVDRSLKAQDERYVRFASQGLFRVGGPGPSALSELRERLTTVDHPDVAEWATGVSRERRDLATLGTN